MWNQCTKSVLFVYANRKIPEMATKIPKNKFNGR
jgi:hypothetical protein